MVFLSICTALYEYEPQSENELALQEGELVFVLEKSDEDDWWKAKKKAPSEDEEEPTGLIPNNYVEEARPRAQAKALYDYSRQTDEELSFSEDAVLGVYDTSDPEWTLVGLDGEYGFAPANYIELMGNAEPTSPTSPAAPQSPIRDEEPAPQTHTRTASGPAAAIAGIMGGRQRTTSVDSPPPSVTLPPRPQQFTPEESDEEAAAPSLPQRPASQQMSPSPTRTQYASPRSPASPTVQESPPHNRVANRGYDGDKSIRPNAGGYHLYNINEMVSAMGKSKKMPTTLGLNLATGQIMIAPEKSRDGPQQEWSAEKLTHYSIEGKHVFMELVKPSKSVDFHAGAKDTAHEIVGALGEIAGAARAAGLSEILEAANGTGKGQKKGQVLYDFMAQGDDEVTVAVGDEVVVVDDTKSDDWWMVRRLKNGKEGVVPSSYVEITGVVAPPAVSRSGANAGKSTVEQNRLEEEAMTKEAMRQSKAEYEVGPGINLPARGSSLTSDGNHASQRSKKESKSHGRSGSTSKTKPDVAKTRTWTDRSGAFKVEAQFIGLKDGKIHLHKLNGVKIAVPVTKMAIEDLEYVERATGVSLEDDKPLSDIKRRSTQSAKDGHKKGHSSGRAGATIDSSKQKPAGSGYDWFDFFLKAGVSPYQCERYAYNFDKDSMDENILSDITPSVLRTLGLKEGDILRVMKYLDNKFGRTGVASPDGASGGLFSGAGGALKNNTAKGRPAPPVQTSDVVNSDAFKQNKEGQRERQGSNASSIPPPPPEKDGKSGGFEDDAWSVKPSKQQAPTQASRPAVSSPPAMSPPPQAAPSQNLLDLSSLQAPLEPQRTQPQTQQPQIQLPQQPPQQQQPAAQQAPGANPAFFSQLGQPQQQTQTQGFAPQQNFQQQPQQTGPPRQRPMAPQLTGQVGSIMPPPPARPLSAPQNQLQSNFGPPPLQPQLTGYQPQSQFGQNQQNIAAPGQSLNDLNQQRLFNQQQQYNQQQQQQQQLQPQQTGYVQQQQTSGFNQFANGIQAQQTGFGQQYGPSQQPAFQNPYVIGQQTGSPFADPRGPKPSFPQMQPQQTGFQPLQPQQTGYQPQFQPSLQPQQTGINSILPPALQPQPTGANGFGRPGFGQPPPPVPPMPPMPQQQPAAAPLVAQKTGPAPPVRFGTPANKLTPQPTGRKANLSNATAANPFGF